MHDDSDEETDTTRKRDFSNVDDEDDISQEYAEVGQDLSVPITRNAAPARTSPPLEVQRKILARDFTSILVALLSQDSLSSQSGSDTQNTIAELEMLESVIGDRPLQSIEMRSSSNV